MQITASPLDLQCADCAAHFQLAPDGSVGDAACSECGGKRFFRFQPSPTQSDGTMRNMVDSDSQHDQGGNPLGEGTIMGDDGERPMGKRDNYMHSKTAFSIYEQIAQLRQRLPGELQRNIDDILRHQGPNAAMQFMQQQNPREQSLGPGTAYGIEPDYMHTQARTLNMEPYPPLWDESYIPRKESFGVGGLMNTLTPGLMAAALMKGALGGGNQAQQPQQLAPGVNEDVKPDGSMSPTFSHTDIPAILAGAWDGARGEVDSVDEHHDDPEKQDQTEFNDGDKNPKNIRNPNNEDSGSDGEDGVRDATDGYGFGENSPGLERMMMLLPLLLQHYQSGESGQNDPLIRGLHEALEAENPDYLKNEHPDGHGMVELVIQQHKQPHDVHAKTAQDPMGGMFNPSIGNPAMTPQGTGQAMALGTCPTCGGALDAQGSCPTCQGAQQGQMQQPQPATGVGGISSMPPNAAKVANDDEPFDPQQYPQDSLENKLFGGPRSKPCPECNHEPLGMLNNGQYHCSNCGYVGGGYPKTATNVGPQTPEQKAAIAQLLIQQGRTHEIPNLELHPEQYAKELNEIQGGSGTVAPLVDPNQPNPSPLPPQMNPAGAMPVPDMSQSGGGMGMPMQPMSAKYPDFLDFDPVYNEEGYAEGERPRGPKRFPWEEHRPGPGEDQYHQDPFYDPNDQTQYIDPLREFPPGPHTNPRGFGQIDEEDYPPNRKEDYLNYIMQSKKADANNHVPRCPECGSATTTVDQVGDNSGDGVEIHKAHCHACDNVWEIGGKKSRVILTELANPMIQNQAPPQGIPGDQMTWQDEQGQPLQVGQTYELYAPGFDIPDQVQVVTKKPNELGLKLVGEFAGMDKANADSHPDFVISSDDLRAKQYTFVPAQGATDEQPQGALGGMPGLEQIPQSGETTDEAKSSYPNQGTLSHALVEENNDMCHKCGGGWVDHRFASPTQIQHECARCAAAWVSTVQGEDHASPHLAWVLDSDTDDDFFDNMERVQAMQTYGQGSRNLSSVAAKDERLGAVRNVLSQNKEARTAGRHFTPKEQRELINEKGTARNLDDLDLSNTHYITRYDPTGKANPYNAPDDHFLMGF